MVSRTTRLLEALNRPVRRLGRLAPGVVDHWGDFLLAALPHEERAAFSALVYERSRFYYSSRRDNFVFDWEERFISEFFPPSPARIVVGGAGGGREAVTLAERGYEVAAFEPLAPFLAHLKQVVPPASLLAAEQAGYEDLVAGLLSLDALAPFDAIVAGWGSISFLFDEGTRAALLPKFRALCPSGPVLVSWYRDRRPQACRARRMFQTALTSAGLKHRARGEVFEPHNGFLYTYPDDEIPRLAAAAGYRVLATDPSGPAALLVPSGVR